MTLPVMPPVDPMLAKSVPTIPAGKLYEPKWDGFRAIVFRDGDSVEIGSRNTKPMQRYFPEVVAAVLAHLPERCVVDGEIIVPSSSHTGLDFEALLQRVHPAESRVRLLSVETPARLVLFDLLALDDDDLTGLPFSERRAVLDGIVRRGGPMSVTAQTSDLAVAERWFSQFEGAGLDGIVAKDPAGLVRARQADDAEDQARADRRLRGRGVPAARVRGRTPSGRCCWGCTRPTACWRPSGWRRRSRWRVGASWSTSWRRW